MLELKSLELKAKGSLQLPISLRPRSYPFTFHRKLQEVNHYYRLASAFKAIISSASYLQLTPEIRVPIISQSWAQLQLC